MRNSERSGSSGEGAGSGAEAGVGAPGTTASHRTEKLLYMSDLIRELGAMSQDLGCRTLTGILSLAREEAELELRRR